MTSTRKSRATKTLNLPDGTGRAGEAAAVSILRRRGYEIVRLNYRAAEGEIDVVTRLDGQLVFVEVKARRSTSFGRPEESISSRKAERLIASGQRYLEETGEEQSDWRIDLLAIEMDNTGRVLRHNIVEHAVGY